MEDDTYMAMVISVVLAIVVALHFRVVVPYYRQKAVDNNAATWVIDTHGHKDFIWNDEKESDN